MALHTSGLESVEIGIQGPGPLIPSFPSQLHGDSQRQKIGEMGTLDISAGPMRTDGHKDRTTVEHQLNTIPIFGTVLWLFGITGDGTYRGALIKANICTGVLFHLAWSIYDTYSIEKCALPFDDDAYLASICTTRTAILVFLVNFAMSIQGLCVLPSIITLRKRAKSRNALTDFQYQQVSAAVC